MSILFVLAEVLQWSDLHPKSPINCVQGQETEKAAKAQQKDFRAINNNNYKAVIPYSSEITCKKCVITLGALLDNLEWPCSSVLIIQ
jgi:hypothetical protein